MGGDTKIQGGQPLPQTQGVNQARQPMPEIPVDSVPTDSTQVDSTQIQKKDLAKAAGKLPASPISLDAPEDPEKAAQSRLLKFSQDVVKAHETDIKAGKPLRLTDDEMVSL